MLHKSLKPNTRKLFYQLLAINVIIIILDITLLSCEFLNLYIIEVTFKGVVYSIKLKLEFAVLSQLVQFATGSQGVSRNPSSCYGNEKSLDFVTLPWGGNDLNRAPSLAKRCPVDVLATPPAVMPVDHIESLVTHAPYIESAAEARLYRHYEERSMSV